MVLQKRDFQVNGKKKHSLLLDGMGQSVPNRRRSFSLELLSVITICALALVLRLWNLEWVEFKGDEAFWCFLAEDILTKLVEWSKECAQGNVSPLVDGILQTLVGGDEGLPVRGQRKLGLRMEAYGGPIVGYFVVVGYYLFGWNPVAGTLVIASLNVVGVLLTYLVGRRLYSHQVGLISSALLATSPWFVLFSRKIWTSVNFPWLLPILLLALWSCARNGRGYAYLVAGISLGIAAQLHLTAFALIPPALIFLILYGKNLDHRNAILLGMGGFLGHLPLIILDLEENWLNFRVYKKLATDPASVRPEYSGGPPEHREEVLKKLWNLTVGSGLDIKLGSGFHYGVYDLPLDIVLIGIVFLSFFAIAWRSMAGSRVLSMREKRSNEKRDEISGLSWKPVVLFLLIGMAFLLAYTGVEVNVRGEMRSIKLFLLISSLSFAIALFSLPLGRVIISRAIGRIQSRFSSAPPNDFLLFLTFGFVMFYTFWGFTGRASGIVHIHYLNVLFPLPFLIASRGIELVVKHFSKPEIGHPSIVRIISLILVLLLIAQNLIIVNRAFNFIDETGGEGEYGTTFASKQEAVKLILDHSKGNFRAYAANTRDYIAYEYLFQSLNSAEINSNYPYIVGGTNLSARINYAIIEPDNHSTAFDSYNSSSIHQILAQFQGVYIFLE
ncbi:MAG: glycosyltransferase family 39 protein [Candidatus Heimdallarchaeota archaeon]